MSMNCNVTLYSSSIYSNSYSLNEKLCTRIKRTLHVETTDLYIYPSTKIAPIQNELYPVQNELYPSKNDRSLCIHPFRVCCRLGGSAGDVSARTESRSTQPQQRQRRRGQRLPARASHAFLSLGLHPVHRLAEVARFSLRRRHARCGAVVQSSRSPAHAGHEPRSGRHDVNVVRVQHVHGRLFPVDGRAFLPRQRRVRWCRRRRVRRYRRW